MNLKASDLIKNKQYVVVKSPWPAFCVENQPDYGQEFRTLEKGEIVTLRCISTESEKIYKFTFSTEKNETIYYKSVPNAIVEFLKER